MIERSKGRVGEEPLLAFRWEVPAAGVQVLPCAQVFRFDGSEDREADALVRRPDPTRRVRFYDPMQEPGLLETLARLPLETEAFVDFANRYGLLLGAGDRWLVPVSGRPPAAGKREELELCELVSDWRDELEELQDAIALWHAYSNGHHAYLREHLPPLIPDEPNLGPRPRLKIDDEGGRANYSSAQSSFSIGGEGSALAPLLDPSKPLIAAKLAFATLLKAKLRRLTAWGPVFDAKSKKLVLRPLARSLLGAAWLLLGEAACGRLRARRCLRCKKWILADPSTERRFARVYCSDTCRVARAERKKRAQKLAAAGRKQAEIAKALDEDVKVIRVWLRHGAPARGKRRA